MLTKKFLSLKQVTDYLDHPNNIVWISAKDLRKQKNESCVDGREVYPIIGTPGGDMAIIVEAVAALVDVKEHDFNESEVSNIVRWYVSYNGSFYHHIDTHGLKHLLQEFNNDPLLPKFKTIKEVEAFIRKPKKEFQIRLLDYLVRSENIGCGHLKLMMLNPSEYHINNKLLISLIRSFFDIMWNDTHGLSNKINYRVLEGNHKEGAVVNILLNEAIITDEILIPMVRPSDGHLSIFVNHPQVSNYEQNNIAQELLKSNILYDKLKKKEMNNFIEKMTDLLKVGTEETVNRLANGLPVYNIVMSPR